MAEDRDEDAILSSIESFSLGSLLNDFSIPTAGLSNRLGLNLQSKAFSFLGEGSIGNDMGEDFEEEVDREMALMKEDEPDTDNEVAGNVVKSAVGTKPPASHIQTKAPSERKKDVYELFPSFAPGKKLPFTDFFVNKPVKRKPPPPKAVTIDYIPEPPSPPPEPETTDFSKPGPAQQGQLSEILQDIIDPVLPRKRAAWETEGTVDDELRKALTKRQRVTKGAFDLDLTEDSFDPVMVAAWEDDIMWTPNAVPWSFARIDDDEEEEEEQAVPEPQTFNTKLLGDEWVKSIMWTPRSTFRPFLEPLPVAAASQVETVPEELPQRPTKKRLNQPPAVNRMALQQRDKFNLSNDHLYELSRGAGGGQQRSVRQTFGELRVEHAYPALKLQLPFYKTRLSKAEARSFHRPPLLFPNGVELHFSRVRKAGKGKDKDKEKEKEKRKTTDDASAVMRRTSDLTLKDGSSYALLEFSEEHPPIMSSFGMGSFVVNYYRKKNDHDEHVPKAELGVSFVLEPKDESPFMKFGSVEPGQAIPAIYNNLIRAPLFRHKPYPTDFLVIRSTVQGETKYFLREIKNLFVVGQTYPAKAVPGPHARAITTTIKRRLEGIVHRLVKKSKQERLKINRLMKYFPDQNELQMRGRLKELMEYHRRGEHQGFWRLKAKHALLPDDKIVSLVTPEDVVLCEAMQVGQRHLLDAGYGQSADHVGENAAEAATEGLDVEQQLAPWIATKHFIAATQGKAMLKLHGEGDPSGRGEAFSFMRTSMKDPYIKAGEDREEKLAEIENRPKNAHRYNVHQQQHIYREEIERIWKAQYDALSQQTEPELSEEEEDQKPVVPAQTPAPSLRRESRALTPKITFRDERQFPRSEFSPPAQSGASYRAASQFSRGSSAALDEDMMSPSVMANNQANANRVLRIRRQQADGTWRTEIVRDQNVINVYVRTRRTIDEENIVADAALPTGDSATDQRLKKKIEQEIIRMKRNQERRLTRKNQHIVKAGGKPLQLDRVSKPDTTRKCGHCGAIGHMKTNRKCPLWDKFNPGQRPLASSPAATQSSSFAQRPLQSPAVGYGMQPPGAYGFPTVSSPLATSPPVSAQPREPALQPKLKLVIKKPQQ